MTQSLSSPGKQTLSLRPASVQDSEAIARLGGAVFASCFGWSMPASDLQAYLDTSYSVSAIAKDLRNPLMNVIVACNGSGCVVGFAQLTRGTTDPCLAGIEGQIELQRLYVDESYHGGGIGKALVNEVERISRNMGFKTMWLGVWEDNFKAQKAYERFGFSKVGAHDFVMGSCVQTDWILTKTL